MREVHGVTISPYEILLIERKGDESVERKRNGKTKRKR
jgi:hypothetical protein